MTAVGVRQPPGYQRPQKRTVLYWSERAGAWWPGVGRRCPACSGVLYAVPPTVETRHGLTPGRVACLLCEREWADVLDVRRPVLTAADLAPEHRGRPPTSAAPKPRKPRLPRRCPDCRARPISQKAERCLDCSRRHREERAMCTRLMLALSDGRPWTVCALCDLLGTTPGALRHVIRKARLRGCAIRLAPRRSYVLAAAS
jgi:hypothetical protein